MTPIFDEISYDIRNSLYKTMEGLIKQQLIIDV